MSQYQRVDILKHHACYTLPQKNRSLARWTRIAALLRGLDVENLGGKSMVHVMAKICEDVDKHGPFHAQVVAVLSNPCFGMGDLSRAIGCIEMGWSTAPESMIGDQGKTGKPTSPGDGIASFLEALLSSLFHSFLNHAVPFRKFEPWNWHSSLGEWSNGESLT